MLETIKDKYLTWRTGRDAKQRELYAWCTGGNIYPGASTIRTKLNGFKHIIPVSWDKIYVYTIAWEPVDDFYNKYNFRFREIGDHAMVVNMRGEFTNNVDIFEMNELFGGDQAFVGTNNDYDAVMIALKYK